MQKKIIVFDYDGVIADSLDATWQMFNKHWTEYGFKSTSKDEFTSFFDHNFYKSLIALGFPEDQLDNLIDHFRRELNAIQADIPLFEDIKDVINKLAKKHTLIIVTSNMAETIIFNLQDNRLHGFSEVLGAETSTSAVEKFLIIKNKYNIKDFYFVTDTVGDIEEAKTAKMKTIAVAWGYQSDKKLKAARPDYFVEEPTKLLDILGE